MKTPSAVKSRTTSAGLRGIMHTVKLGLILLIFAVIAAHLGAYLGEYDEGPLLQAPALANEGYALYDDVVLNKPPLLTWWLQVGLALGGTSLEVGHLFILFLTLLGYAALGALADELFGPWAGVATMAAVWSASDLVTNLLVVNVDLPAASLGTIALLAAARAYRRRKRRWAVVAGASFAAAAGIHPLLVYTALPIGFLLLAPDPCGAADGQRPAGAGSLGRLAREAWPGVWRFGAAAAAVAAAWVLPVISPDFLTWVYHYNTAAFGETLTAFAEADRSRLVTYLVQEHGLLSAGTVLAAASLWQTRRMRFGLLVIIAWLGVTLAALTQLRPLWSHYLVLALFPMLLLLGAAGAHAWQPGAWRRSKRRLQAIAGAVVSVLVLSSFLMTPPRWDPWPAEEQAVKAFLTARTSPGSLIVTDHQLAVFRAARLVPPSLADTSIKRLSTGYLDVADIVNAMLQDAPEYLIVGNGKLEQIASLIAWAESWGTEIQVDPGVLVYELPDPPEMDTALDVQFGSDVRMVGYTVTSGTPMRVTLFLQADQAPEHDYRIFVHLLDEAGHLVTQRDGEPFAGLLPTTQWLPGLIVPHTVLLDAPLAPGAYTVTAGLYTVPEMQRLPVTLRGEAGAPARVADNVLTLTHLYLNENGPQTPTLAPPAK